jgi:hypothetical protein
MQSDAPVKADHDRHWQDIRCSVCDCIPAFDGIMDRPLQCVGCLAIFCTNCYEDHYARRDSPISRRETTPQRGPDAC